MLLVRFNTLAGTLVLLFILGFNLGKSQSMLGLTGGANVTDVNFQNTSSRTNYFGGLTGKIPITEKFSFNPNLLYALKGWKFKSLSPTEAGGEMNLHYLDIQLLGKYAIHKSISLATGVEIGTLMKTRRDPYEVQFDNLYNKKDISLVFGFDLAILKSLHMEFKYLHGLSYLAVFDSTDINGNDLGKTREGQLRVFQIGLAADLVSL